MQRICLLMQEPQEGQVQSLGGEDPLEKGMATHSTIIAWNISWTEEPAGSGLWGHKESDTTEHTCIHCVFTYLLHFLFIFTRNTGSNRAGIFVCCIGCLSLITWRCSRDIQ